VLTWLAANDNAFVFVTEFEIRHFGTNADQKYEGSLLNLQLNL
jgi:hypothetical protein